MLLRQTLLYLPAQVIGPVFQFLAIVVWTHWLAPSELGLLALLIAAQELMHVAVAWFSFYTLRYLSGPDAAAGSPSYRSTEAFVMALGAALAVVGALVLAVVLDRQQAGVALLVLSIPFMFTRSVTMHLSDRARASGDIISYSILQISTSVLGLALGLIGAELIAPTALVALAGLTLAQVIAMAAVAVRMAMGGVFWRPDRPTLEAALRYGAPFMLSGPLVWTTTNAIRYLVDFWHGSVAVGLMTVGWVIGQRGAAVAAMLTTAASFPLAVQRTRDGGVEEGVAQLSRNGTLLMMCLAPAMGGLFAIGPQLTRTVVAVAYQDPTIAIIPWSVLAGLARNMRIHFANQIFLLRERPDVALRVDAIDAFVSLVLCALGLWLGGIVGAVAGAAIGALIGLAASAGLGVLSYGMKLPAGDLVRIAIATLAMIGAVRLLPAHPGVLGLALSILAGMAVYGLLIAALFPRVVAVARTVSTRVLVAIKGGSFHG